VPRAREMNGGIVMVAEIERVTRSFSTHLLVNNRMIELNSTNSFSLEPILLSFSSVLAQLHQWVDNGAGANGVSQSI